MLNFCWDSQYSLGIRPHETPTGRQHAAEPSLHSARTALLSPFFVFLVSLGDFFGLLVPLLVAFLDHLTIFIDFFAFRGRFSSIFEPSRGAPTLDFARPYGTLATFLENHRFPLGLLLGPS